MSIKQTFIGIKQEAGIYLPNIWVYAKYQLITKGILLLFIFLLSTITENFLIKTSGFTVLSSGNFRSLLFSLRGIGFALVGLILFLIAIAIDINAFIEISASIRITGRPIRVTYALLNGIKSTKTLFSPAGLFLALYTMLIVPLVSVGLKTSLFKGLKIPNFITSVIYETPIYALCYIVLIIIFAVIGFFLILSFHFMHLYNQSSKNAIKSSISTVWKNKFSILGTLVLFNIILFLVIFVSFNFIYFVINLIDSKIINDVVLSRFVMMFIVITFSELINLWIFLTAPLQIHIITGKFYTLTQNADVYNKYDYSKYLVDNSKYLVDTTTKSKKLRRFGMILLVILTLIFNLSISGISAVFFDEIFRYRPDVEIVAHRGGGYLGAENTILGLNSAIDAGAQWSEIDVMRTKDGVYIIHHDATFSRLAGIKNRVSEMTWDEIKNLQIKDTFDSSRPSGNISELTTFMDVAKDRIGLFIELKGVGTDTKMADYVIDEIYKKDMIDSAVIISLDYNLIKYIEDNYPEINTGFLYYFSFGNVSRINTDYLIMEEALVNPDTIEKIQNSGKKVFVWTVNDPLEINNLLTANIDGIITDNVIDMAESIKKWDNKTDREIIFDEVENLLSVK